ncbi:hypothetical protein ACRYWZ_15555 [Agrobacterium deltaense]|uniref:hypothetical protein n=1 Tax=Agrobacterium deltaense TaxID=1183412 RepID=UPI003D99407B
MREQDRQRFQALEEAAIQGAASTLKSLLLLNGGACVALLAFIGSTATSDKLRPNFVPLVEASVQSLGSFAVGAGIAVFAMVTAYLTNHHYANSLIDPENTRWGVGSVMFTLTSMLTLFSLALFGKGIYLIWESMP